MAEIIITGETLEEIHHALQERIRCDLSLPAPTPDRQDENIDYFAPQIVRLRDDLRETKARLDAVLRINAGLRLEVQQLNKLINEISNIISSLEG